MHGGSLNFFDCSICMALVKSSLSPKCANMRCVHHAMSQAFAGQGSFSWLKLYYRSLNHFGGFLIISIV